MREAVRILLLLANPWSTCRIRVDEEYREILERLQEGPCGDAFDLRVHMAVRPSDLQKLLMVHQPHIVHVSAHSSKSHRLILSGAPGKGQEIDQDGLAELLALYRRHVRLVFLNACFTRTQAVKLSGEIDYAIGTGKGIGDRGGVAFAAAFYRALSFGWSVREAFSSAKAEVALTKMRRTNGLELFVREGLDPNDQFPRTVRSGFSNNGGFSPVNYGDVFGGDTRRRWLGLTAPTRAGNRNAECIGLRCRDQRQRAHANLLDGNGPEGLSAAASSSRPAGESLRRDIRLDRQESNNGRSISRRQRVMSDETSAAVRKRKSLETKRLPAKFPKRRSTKTRFKRRRTHG